jgi:hypothetical protein
MYINVNNNHMCQLFSMFWNDNRPPSKLNRDSWNANVHLSDHLTCIELDLKKNRTHHTRCTYWGPRRSESPCMEWIRAIASFRTFRLVKWLFKRNDHSCPAMVINNELKNFVGNRMQTYLTINLTLYKFILKCFYV